MNENRRILAVDPGEKRIGLAASDPSGTIASPLRVIKHEARAADAAAIVAEANRLDAVRIIVGQALGDDGELTPSARHAERLMEAIREMTGIPVEGWDESGSTNEAVETRRLMGVSRKKRSGHLDELAAVIILQSYLDAHR